MSFKKNTSSQLRNIVGVKPTEEDMHVLARNYSYLMIYGAQEIKDEVNIEVGVVANEPLSAESAARELGFTGPDPAEELRQMIAQYGYSGLIGETKAKLKEGRRDYLKDLSEGLIEQALTGELEISADKRVDAAFRLLEKTDKAYNPKVEIEQTHTIDMSYEDALKQFKELNLESNTSEINLLDEFKDYEDN